MVMVVKLRFWSEKNNFMFLCCLVAAAAFSPRSPSLFFRRILKRRFSTRFTVVTTYTKKRRRNIMHKKINYKSAPYTHPPHCQNKIKKKNYRLLLLHTRTNSSMPAFHPQTEKVVDDDEVDVRELVEPVVAVVLDPLVRPPLPPPPRPRCRSRRNAVE